MCHPCVKFSNFAPILGYSMGKVMRLLNIFAFSGLSCLLVSCTQKQERLVTPYGSVLDSVAVTEDFDLMDIQTNGELIMATVSGPETYYDYHGRQLGTQYLICQHFADSLGVRLRVDVCRDSTEQNRKCSPSVRCDAACSRRCSTGREASSLIMISFS